MKNVCVKVYKINDNDHSRINNNKIKKGFK